MTEGDNRNIMAAQLAAEAFRVGQVIAKINDPLRALAYAELGIATICRTDLMANAVLSYLKLPVSVVPGVRSSTGHHRHETGRRSPARRPGQAAIAAARPDRRRWPSRSPGRTVGRVRAAPGRPNPPADPASSGSSKQEG